MRRRSAGGRGTRSKNSRSWLLSGRSASVMSRPAPDRGLDLGHVGVDRLPAQGARHRHAVVPVAHEVQLADPVQGDRRHRLAAALGLGHAFPASAQPAGRGPEAAVEFLRAIDRADDRVELHHPQTEMALARAAQGRQHLLQRQDEPHVVGLAPQAPSQVLEHARSPRAKEVALRVGAGESGVRGHAPNHEEGAGTPEGAPASRNGTGAPEKAPRHLEREVRRSAEDGFGDMCRRISRVPSPQASQTRAVSTLGTVGDGSAQAPRRPDAPKLAGAEFAHKTTAKRLGPWHHETAGKDSREGRPTRAHEEADVPKEATTKPSGNRDRRHGRREGACARDRRAVRAHAGRRRARPR